MDKITNDARVYTDVQGLDKLRGQYKSNPDAVKKEVSQQFESLLFQMVLRSMRDANSAYNSDLFSSNDMSFYQDMFDKQLSLSLSAQGVGFAKMIEENIDQQSGVRPSMVNNQILPLTQKNEAKGFPISMNTPTKKVEPVVSKADPAPVVSKPEPTKHFPSPRDFMHSLWNSAKQAAKMIGVHPSVLLAQAALETNWGKNIIATKAGDSTHNLFNIKSDAHWHKGSSSAATLEQKDGVLVKETASFRSYPSYQESFLDYASMVKMSPRYKKAVDNAQDSGAYTQALQEAGYATDSQYSQKIMGILNSPSFKSLLAELTLI